MYDETVQLLTTSLLERDRTPERLYLLAVAMMRTEKDDEASRLFLEILEANPDYWRAMPNAGGSPSELIEQLLAAEEEDLHLNHIVLFASVAVFSRMDQSETQPQP